jgi:hypothetical protein
VNERTEHGSLVGCCAGQSGGKWQTFQRSFLPHHNLHDWGSKCLWNVGQFLSGYIVTSQRTAISVLDTARTWCLSRRGRIPIESNSRHILKYPKFLWRQCWVSWEIWIAITSFSCISRRCIRMLRATYGLHFQDPEDKDSYVSTKGWYLLTNLNEVKIENNNIVISTVVKTSNFRGKNGKLGPSKYKKSK